MRIAPLAAALLSTATAAEAAGPVMMSPEWGAKDGKAQCVFGGAVETKQLDSGADYVMFAETERWQEMGRGEYGPMKAMAFGRLGFKGPKMEAMGNMGPFSNFLRLVGKVESDVSSCPTK